MLLLTKSSLAYACAQTQVHIQLVHMYMCTLPYLTTGSLVTDLFRVYLFYNSIYNLPLNSSSLHSLLSFGYSLDHAIISKSLQFIFNPKARATNNTQIPASCCRYNILRRSRYLTNDCCILHTQYMNFIH